MSESPAVHAVAGGAAGIVAMTATYPLIFLSTRAAVETKNESKSTYQAVVDIVKREGPLGMYSGLSSSLLGIAVTNGVYYYFYERARGIVQKGKALTTGESIIMGIIAGSATTIISNPIWVVQTKQAVQTLNEAEPSLDPSQPKVVKKLSIIETIRAVLREGGIQAFWRGIGPALVLVINPVLQYTAFEQMKNFLIARRTAKLRAAGLATAVAALSDWDFFLLGALAKLMDWAHQTLVVATSSTYPYIVVKSRLQAGHANALKYKSAIDGLLTILKDEGLQGLYKGVGNKLIQSVLTAAILFAGQRRIYEITKKAISG
ncbi:Peroxisomal membrane protein [Mycena sanguinolenta]|uniref:Peroxisomal membrane protein n=1 Tax=Mycena sanguinolenta TaxID=230812 RepID=A0A8H6Y8Q7_9AGAR|nr:Peroxisomal membrane protein [Mycena sanguinolenta]